MKAQTNSETLVGLLESDRVTSLALQKYLQQAGYRLAVSTSLMQLIRMNPALVIANTELISENDLVAQCLASFPEKPPGLVLLSCVLAPQDRTADYHSLVRVDKPFRCDQLVLTVCDLLR